jgi:hypothetical protein
VAQICHGSGNKTQTPVSPAVFLITIWKSKFGLRITEALGRYSDIFEKDFGVRRLELLCTKHIETGIRNYMWHWQVIFAFKLFVFSGKQPDVLQVGLRGTSANESRQRVVHPFSTGSGRIFSWNSCSLFGLCHFVHDWIFLYIY